MSIVVCMCLLRRKHLEERVKDALLYSCCALPRWLPMLHTTETSGVLRCEQGLRRMLLFGFQADARTLQEVPAVSQVLQALAAFALSKYLTKRVSGRTAV